MYLREREREYVVFFKQNLFLCLFFSLIRGNKVYLAWLDLTWPSWSVCLPTVLHGVGRKTPTKTHITYSQNTETICTINGTVFVTLPSKPSSAQRSATSLHTEPSTSFTTLPSKPSSAQLSHTHNPSTSFTTQPSKPSSVHAAKSHSNAALHS